MFIFATTFSPKYHSPSVRLSSPIPRVNIGIQSLLAVSLANEGGAHTFESPSVSKRSIPVSSFSVFCSIFCIHNNKASPIAVPLKSSVGEKSANVVCSSFCIAAHALFVKGIYIKGFQEKVISEILYQGNEFIKVMIDAFAAWNLLGCMSVHAIDNETSTIICIV